MKRTLGDGRGVSILYLYCPIWSLPAQHSYWALRMELVWPRNRVLIFSLNSYKYLLAPVTGQHNSRVNPNQNSIDLHKSVLKSIRHQFIKSLKLSFSKCSNCSMESASHEQRCSCQSDWHAGKWSGNCNSLFHNMKKSHFKSKGQYDCHEE